MSSGTPLVHTKLRLPFIRPEIVARPRLYTQVMDGLHGPLTLVTAPAGFGKTTLLVSSVATHEGAVVWLSLDKEDNQVDRFLKYMVAALQGADQTVGHDAAIAIAASAHPPPEFVMTTLVNDLDALSKEVVFVLDDYHVISSQAVHSAMTFLIEHCPATLHLVIATRSDPPLPLARLRARGQIAELRATDLSFTEPEASQFLNNVIGLNLQDSAITLLRQRTEGWVAGLQMAALAMRGRDDLQAFIEGFSGTNRYVLDYLLEEVLAQEPKETQSFLLQTSFLTRLTGSLCDAVVGATGSAEMLEQLELRNLFIMPLDDQQEWYRYHHLFADLLQAHLYKTRPDQVPDLQLQAAKWCEQNGHIDEAISYALAAEDFEHAARLIAAYWGDVASAGAIETAWSWLNALPEDTIKNSASLGVAYCWVLWFKGHIEQIESHLVHAEGAWRDQENESGADLPAQLVALRSIIARYQGDYETAITHAKHALQLLPEHLPAYTNAQLRMLISFSLASACEGVGHLEQAVNAYTESTQWSRAANNPAGIAATYRLAGILRLLGRLRDADQVCRQALEYAGSQDMNRLPAAGILHIAMSEVLVEQNKLDEAREHLAQAVELGKGGGRLDAARNVAFSLVRLRLAHGDAEGAFAAIHEAISALEEPPSPLAKAELLALQSRIHLHQGTIHDAIRCVAKAVQLAGWDRGLTGSLVALAEARVAGAQQDALVRLARAVADTESMRHFGAVIELRVLRSLLFVAQVKLSDAYADLERALELAGPEGYVRVFLDEGQPMQILIARWLSQSGDGPLRGYAAELLEQFESEPLPAAAVSPQQVLIEPLTARELEVLHIMALGKTNQQIAEQLVVARGTVKAHTASIYRKLDTTNRTEAVARARELGILL